MKVFFKIIKMTVQGNCRKGKELFVPKFSQILRVQMFRKGYKAIDKLGLYLEAF